LLASAQPSAMPNRRRLLQPEHVVDVGRVDQRVHQRHFGRAGIAEHMRDPFVTQNVEQNVAGASGHGWASQCVGGSIARHA